MKRCPICHRFGIESISGEEKCMWTDCSPRPKPNYRKFRDAIKIKK